MKDEEEDMDPGQNTLRHEGRSKVTMATQASFTGLVVVDRKHSIF